MKFGGTSVGDPAAVRRVIDIVSSRLTQKPVVVVSALSGITDALYKIADFSAAGDFTKADELVNDIQTRHIAMCGELFGSNLQRVAYCENEVIKILNDLRIICKGVSILCELSHRSLARIISTGELLSSLIVTQSLQEMGVNAKLTDARSFIITDSQYLKGEPDFYQIREKAPAILRKELSACDTIVTQGFISSDTQGVTTVLGRGGSDYTASLIGMALEVSEIEIWTDVDGVHTVDPRRVEKTWSIAEISFEEAAELASFGAKVLHPLTIQPAIEKNIPVRVLNSMNPSNPGTLILRGDMVKKSGVKSISFKEHITVINIFSTKMLNTSGFLGKVFAIFEKHKASVDLISTSEVNISLTLDNSAGLEQIVAELSRISKVSVESDKSQISVIGKDLKTTKGVVGRVFGTLGEYNVNMISQGASNINISFVVDRRDLNGVIALLHREFFENESHES